MPVNGGGPGGDPDGQSKKIVAARMRCMADEQTRWIVLALLLMRARAELTQERSGGESGFFWEAVRVAVHTPLSCLDASLR